ncbi:MAG: type 4a pilus biogenesis protein PilO [Planctomycetota bacterium]
MRFRNRRDLIVIIMFLITSAAFLLLKCLPLQRRVEAASEAKLKHEFAIATKIANLEQLPIVRAELRKQREIVGNFDAKIPMHRDLGPFSEQLLKAIDEHSLKAEAIIFGNEIPSEDDDIVQVPVSIRCTGSFQQILGLVESLEHCERLVRIGHSCLSSASDYPDNMEMAMEIYVYYRNSELKHQSNQQALIKQMANQGVK